MVARSFPDLIFNSALIHCSFKIELTYKAKQAAADTKLHWIRLEDDMQLTTASLMKEASSNKGSSVS